MALRLNVCGKPGWILERLARETVAAVPGAEYNATGYPPMGPDTAAATYFMPMMDARLLPDVAGLRVGLFTHGEDRAREMLAAFRWDACVVMNRRMEAALKAAGAPNVLLARPGVDRPGRPIRFGVCGHFHNKKRKGVFLIGKAVRSGFDFRACGNPKEQELLRCEITHTTSKRAEFYNSIDYLVVTSLEEGGPMTVPEALAHGVPVIAPDVGWSHEYPCIHYEKGSWDSLKAVLEGITCPPSWDVWRAVHRGLFDRLLGAA